MTSTDFQPAPIPTGRQNINGKTYVVDAKGGLQPIETVKPQDILQDETVRRIMGFGIALSDQVGRFKQHTMEDLTAFEGILAQEYRTKIGGEKGNKTLMSLDGLFKVQVQVADQLDFGPELQIAKKLVDECLIEWSEESGPELRDIVRSAFNTDKAGQINRSEIFMLLRRDIEDERWQRAMQAIRDAIRVVGSKTYVRCYRRETGDGAWEAVTIDMAKA